MTLMFVVALPTLSTALLLGGATTVARNPSYSRLASLQLIAEDDVCSTTAQDVPSHEVGPSHLVFSNCPLKPGLARSLFC